LAWRAMPQELFPVIQLDMASIQTSFDGASPAEVEQQVTVAIEEEFKENEDIDYLASTSSEGVSNIYIKLKAGARVDDFMRDARTVLDRITELPELAEEPELTRIRARFPVISLSLYGDLSEAALFDEAESVRRQMMKLPGVASVVVTGDREWEIWTVVDPHVLAARKVSLQQVIDALAANLRDQPGGSIKSVEGDIRLRGLGVVPAPEAIEQIVIRGDANTGLLRIGDIARVERRFEEPQTYARLNGAPSVNLTVTKTAEASTIAVADDVKALSEQLRASLPASISVGYHTDMSEYVKSRLNTVKSSGLIGLVLVLLALYLLLNFRTAAVTAFGIPVSFLIALILLYVLGYSINMVSLFAFLIVLGMIVDDAIIVTENVYRHIEAGMPPEQAAVQGTREVFWPVVVATATTIAAFLPMFAIGSTLGAFIEVIPVVVACALLGSLWEAFMVLPTHAAYILKKSPPSQNPRRPDWQRWLQRYTRLLSWSVANRYLVLTASGGVLAVSLVYAQTRLPFEMFGNVEIGQFYVNIETPNTYSLQATLDLAERLEDEVLEILDPETELKTMLTNVGMGMIDFNRTRVGSNQLQLIIDLKKPQPEGLIENWISPLVNFNSDDFGPRERAADDIINQVRERLSRIAGVERLSIMKPDAGPAGDDIEIGVVSNSISILDETADEITDYLRQLPGVYDVQHDQEPGKLEYRYVLNESGQRLGLTQSQIATAVRSGYLGFEAVYVTWRDQRIPVRVIYPEAVREQSQSLTNLPIVTDSGVVYLEDVADIELRRDLNDIRRRDGQRMAKLTAAVDSQITTALKVTEQVNKEFSPATDAPYSLLFLGEKKDAEDSFKGMNTALLIALVLIFFMLTALFKSMLDPLVIILTIPFGFVGVVFGHALFGYHLQFLSAVGMLALTGIIVNDSLILVKFIKDLRAAGSERMAAVIEAGRVRARPILLTTITTFLGVSPLIFFATGQTAFLSPMAVSLGFGLLFATLLILLVLPSMYLIFDDLRNMVMTRLKPQPPHQ
ncbi:MAG: efflux RND transporter permease subunit, partial [Gammaproteobacteria bacterium]